MHRHSKYIIASAIVLMATSAALSKDGGLPNLDIQKQCQKIRGQPMSSPALKIQTPLICALRPNKVHAKSLPGAGRLPRPWIKQPVFIRRVGHQAISNGLGA